MSERSPAASLLATDFYQLTMLDAYRQAGMSQRAGFEFFARNLPQNRRFLVAAGLETLLERLEEARFAAEELDWLRTTGRFSTEAIDALAAWRFRGDVFAVPEGSIVFSDEPILRVEAEIAEAQLVETLVINQLHYQTLIASKAARLRLAAPNAQLIDFGLRRAHSLDAGVDAARAAYIGGFDGTATALAAMRFDVPVYGTMAHSFIQAHDEEERAFLDFAAARPDDTIFLIDTYDVERAAQTVVRITGPLRAKGITIRGVRIDSGDLGAHAGSVRRILDDAGLQSVRIVVSGGLDEAQLRKLVASGAPIDSYGIGTGLTTSQDLPALDCAYKLISYADTPRRKRSEGKILWPGAKQIFRHYGGTGRLERDMLGIAGEAVSGTPLLQPVMHAGRRLRSSPLADARERALAGLAQLPEALRDPSSHARYPVEFSPGLRALSAHLDAIGR